QVPDDGALVSVAAGPLERFVEVAAGVVVADVEEVDARFAVGSGPHGGVPSAEVGGRLGLPRLGWGEPAQVAGGEGGEPGPAGAVPGRVWARHGSPGGGGRGGGGRAGGDGRGGGLVDEAGEVGAAAGPGRFDRDGGPVGGAGSGGHGSTIRRVCDTYTRVIW